MAKTKECDCAHFPWQPKCYKVCGGALIFRASEEYLTAVLNLEPEVVQKISAGRKRNEWESFDDLAGILSNDEFAEVITRVQEYSEEKAKEPVLTVLEQTAEAEEEAYQDENVKEH